MTAYAIAHLHDLRFGPDIVACLQAIDATLAPYGEHFLAHGSSAEVLEGLFSGDVVVIAFPDRVQACAWYRSPAYQAILPLRTRNAHGWVVVLVDGAGEGHRATDLLQSVTSRGRSGPVLPPDGAPEAGAGAA